MIGLGEGEMEGAGPLSSLLGMIGLGETGGLISDKTRDGQQAYRQFMKEHKEKGMSHKEALAAWKNHKAMSHTPVTKARQRKQRSPEKEAKYCMDYLGLEADDGVLRDEKMEEEIRDELIAETKAKEAAPEPLVTVMNDNELDRIERKTKRKGKPLTEEHRAKLQKGQAEFLHFMEMVKSKGMSHKEALALHRKLKAESGGHWYNDFLKGFMIPIKAAAKVLPFVL
jgi:hypothetical protein